MKDLLTLVGYALFIGVNATIFLDVDAVFGRKVFKTPSLNYAFLEQQ